jgi:hypothetical protein
MNPLPVPNALANEPVITLPASLAFGVIVVSGAVACVAWTIATWLLGYGSTTVLAGPWAAAAVVVAGLVGAAAMGPGKARRVGDWMTRWLASTVVRLLLTPILTFVLYSATSLEPVALTLAVAVTYLVVLLAEAWFLARYVAGLSTRQPAAAPQGSGVSAE